MPNVTSVSLTSKLKEIKRVIRSLLISLNSKDVTLKVLSDVYLEVEGTNIPFKDFNFTSLKEFLKSLDDVCRLEVNDDDKLCVYHIDTEKTKHVSKLVSLSKTKSNKQQTRGGRSHLKTANKLSPYLIFCIFNKLLRKAPANIKKIKKEDVLNEILNYKYIYYEIKDLNDQLNNYSHILAHNDDYICFKVNNMSESRDKKSEFFESVSDLIPTRTKDRLRVLIKKFPQGIYCSKLPEFFRNEFNLDIDYSSLGFANIIEFIIALPKLLKIVTLEKSKIQVVVDAECNDKFYVETPLLTQDIPQSYVRQPSVTSTPRTRILDPVPKVVSSQIYLKLTSDNTVRIDDIVEQINVTSLVQTSKDDLKIDVIVSEVFYPTFFWVILNENKKKLRSFVKKMNQFYEMEKLDNYVIPPVLLQPGMKVACKFFDIWYRGVVKKISNEVFTVLLFDYGSVGHYKVNELYFLDKKFFSFPAQAIPCSLNNVQPLNNKWSKEICKAFSNKVLEKTFSAHVQSIDEEKNSMKIVLIDVNGNNVNELMIRERLAAEGTFYCDKIEATLKLYQRCLKLPKQLLEENLKKKLEEDKSNDESSFENMKEERRNHLSMSEKLEVLRKSKARSSSLSSPNSTVSSDTTYEKVEKHEIVNITLDDSTLDVNVSDEDSVSSKVSSLSPPSSTSMKSLLDSDDLSRTNSIMNFNFNFGNATNLQFVESNKGCEDDSQKKSKKVERTSRNILLSNKELQRLTRNFKS